MLYTVIKHTIVISVHIFPPMYFIIYMCACGEPGMPDGLNHLEAIHGQGVKGQNPVAAMAKLRGTERHRTPFVG